MGFCAISDKQKNAFAAKVAEDLGRILSSKNQSFNLESYINHVYKQIEKNTQDPARAIAFVSLIPGNLQLLSLIDNEVKSLLLPYQEAIAKLKVDFENVDNVIAYVIPVVDESAPVPAVKINQIDKKQQELNRYSLLVAGFSGRPATYNATTLGDDKASTKAGNAFAQILAEEYIKQYGDNAISEISARYGLLLVDATDRNIIRDSDIAEKELKTGTLLVVSDVNGNILYFDHQELLNGVIKQVDKSVGNPIVYRMRTSPTTIQSAEEISKQTGIPVEDVVKELAQQSKEVQRKKEYVTSARGNTILHSIVGLSTGYLPSNSENPVALKDSNINMSEYVITALSITAGQQKIAIKKNSYTQMIPIRGNFFNNPNSTFNISEDLRNAILDVLTGNNIKVENFTEGLAANDNNITLIRQRFAYTYLGNNKNIIINDNGVLFIKDGNNTVQVTFYDESTGEFKFKPGYSREILLDRLSKYQTKDGTTQHQAVVLIIDTINDVPYGYTRNQDNTVVIKELDSLQYKNFIKDNSYTPIQKNPVTQDFDAMHPYFTYDVATNNQDKLEETPEEEVELIETPIEQTTDFESLNLSNQEFEDAQEDDWNKLISQNITKATEEQIREAYEWWKNHPMSSKVPFNAMFELLNPKNGQSIATFNKYGITLFKGSDYTDLYHEAFHAFTQIFLSPSEQAKMYRAVRKLKGSTTDYLGKKVLFSDMEPKQIEEYLAEKFREYMLSGGKAFAENTPTEAKSWFRKLLDILTAVFGFNSIDLDSIADNYTATAQLNEYFNNLREGNISDVPVDFSTVSEFDKLKSIKKEDESIVDNLSYTDLNLLVNTMNSLISTIINERDTANVTNGRKFSSIVTSLGDRVVLYQKVFNRLNALYKENNDLLKSALPGSEEYNKALYKTNLLALAMRNYSPVGAKITADDVIAAANPEARGLIAYHMQKTDFISLDDVYDIEEQSKSGKDYNKNEGNQKSAKELADKDVIFLLKSLQRKKLNELGVPELEDFIYTWNLMSKLSAGSSNAQDIYEKLNAFVNNIAEDESDKYLMRQVLNKMGNPSITVQGGNFKDYLAQQNLWTKIQNVFTLPTIKLVQLTVDYNTQTNTTNITTGISKSSTDPIKRSFDNSFGINNAKYVVSLRSDVIGNEKKSTTGNFLNVSAVLMDFKETPKSNEDKIKFLHALGINVTNNKDMQRTLKVNANVNSFIKALYTKLKEIQNVDNNLKQLGEKKGLKYFNGPSDLIEFAVDGSSEITNLSTGYRMLLEKDLKHSGLYGQGMVSNAKGDPQYEISLKSTISEQIRLFNSASSYSELISIPEMAHLDVNRNPFVKTLKLMTQTFGDNFWEPGNGARQKPDEFVTGFNRNNEIQLLNSAGVSLLENEFLKMGVSSNEADDTTQILQNFFTYMLYGVSEGTRHSDKSTTLYYRNSFGGEYIRFREFFGEPGPKNVSITQRMKKYLGSEVSRIVRLMNNDPAGTATVGDTTYKEAGSKLVTFEGILDDKLRASIEEWAKKYKVKKGNTSNIEKDFEEKWLSKNADKVNAQILSYFKKQTDDFSKDLAKTGVLSNSLWQSVKNQVRGLDPYKNSKTYNESLIEAFVVNDWIHKYETTILFYGDPALYNHLKEEFHKRNPFIAATGTIPRTDAAMINFLRSYKAEDKYASSKYFRGKLSERAKNKSWGRVLDSAVLEDSKYRSEYLDEYIKLAKAHEKARLGRALTDSENKAIDDEFSEYAKMKIGDGQGWITFDSYRDLLISMGKWSVYQEELYWDIIKGKDVSKAKLAQFFPVKKMQYGGPLATKEGLPLQGYHKFSLMPLIPTVIKGTKLETLHNKLVAQGIDYALFQSGSKINSITKEGTPDKFYTDNTKLTDVEFEKDDYEFTINPIFTNYFKDQVEIQESYKGSVIFSTQLRKLIEEGLYENGRPKSFNGTKEDFEKLSKAQKDKYEEYRKLVNYENHVRALTEYKVRELQRDAGLVMGANGKLVLTDKLINYLNKQLSMQDLAEHEIDFIKYDTRSGRLVFDLSYHPSANKIDKLISALIYKKIVKQKVKGEALIQVSGAGFEASGLRAATDEENEQYQKGLPFYRYTKTGVKAMKVKIALQGDFKKLLYHPSVIERAKQKDISAIEALNQLIKEESWLKENSQLITISGVRIPVQGLNSMEFMEVYEFLPEESGNMIVLPREIVAKTGGDFDIDKLSLMFPSLIKTAKGVSLVKYDRNAEENLEANKETLLGLYEDKQKIIDKLLNWTYRKEDEIEESEWTRLKTQIDNLKIKRSTLKEDLALSKRSGLDDAEYLYDQIIIVSDEIDNIFNALMQIGKAAKQIKTQELQPINSRIDDMRVAVASGSSRGIENDLLFSVVDILKMPTNFVDFITPNSTSVLKPIADNLSKYSDYNKHDTLHNEDFRDSKNKKRITATKIFELGFNRYKQRSNNIGKRTLGIGAVSNTFNTILSRVGAYMEANVELGRKKKYNVEQTFRGGLEFNKTANGEISLAGLYDAKKQHRVSKLISQGINGWVDVAKDSWIFDIQGNPEIGPILLFMIQAGVPVEQAIYFLSQPIIKDYVTKTREIKGAFATPLGIESANTNNFRNQARADILKALDPTLKDVVVSLGEDVQLPALSKTQIKKYIYETLVPEYLKNTEVDFSEETLLKNLDKKDYYDTDSMKIFLHFIEIEEMSKAITEIQQGLNFDTSKLGNIYEIYSKSNNVSRLNKERRLNASVVDDIINNSSIGSFISNSDTFLDFLQDMFPTRSNKYLYDALDKFSTMSDAIIEKYPLYFSDFDELSSRYVDDFTNFIYQQYELNKLEKFDLYAPFMGFSVSDKYVQYQVATSSLMKRAAIADNGVLYVNVKQLKNDYEKGTYAKLYENVETEDFPPPAPIMIQNVSTFNAYAKFVYAREALRSMISFDDYATSKDYTVRLLVSTHTTDKEIKVYEEFLRDTAMMQVSNGSYMFSANGFASQVSFISKKFPELLSKYKILGSLYASVFKGTHNLRLSELTLDSDTINIYHEELQRLANPNVSKVDNSVDNTIISNLFSKFPLFSFLQNGLDGKGQLSLSRIVPTQIYADLLQSSGTWYQRQVSNKEEFVKKYTAAFNRMYSTPEDTVADEDVDYGRKPIRKFYSAFTINTKGEIVTQPEKTFVYKDDFNQDISLYNYKNLTKEQFEKAIVGAIKDAEAQNKKLIFVFTKGINETSSSILKDSFNSSYLLDMVKRKVISPENVFGITTKKDNYVNVSDQLLTDSTYKSNVDLIEKQLQELLSKKNDSTEIVFMDGLIGASLLGYGFSELPVKQPAGGIARIPVAPYKGVTVIQESTDKNVIPAPETYVYLSKRLFELFSYSNPYIGPIAKISKEGKSLAQEMVKRQSITDAQVNEILNKCFNSLLE